MPIASLSFPLPIRRRPSVAPRNFIRRDRAIELFESLRFDESVCETLAYPLPELRIPDLRTQAFSFVQGSARVHLSIAGERLVVRAVLAALPSATSATAALRYFLSRLSSTGQVFQPRLNERTIALEFADDLRLLHPHKLIEILQRLPMEADSNDGWMVGQFGVETPDREPLTALDDDESRRAIEIWQLHWASVDELMVECRRRRSLRFLDALATYAVDQTRYLLPLNGAVRAKLNEAADVFADKDGYPNRRETTLVKCIREMRAIEGAELALSLGHASYAINPLREGTPSLLTSILGGGSTMQTIGELRASGRALEAAIELIADYHYLLAHQTWSPEIEAALRAALDGVSNRPWRDVADGLWNHANLTAKIYGSHGETDRDEPAADHDGDSRYEQ